MSSFADALELVLRFEGGYVDDPSDPGGATNKGITQTTYDDWRKDQNLPSVSVQRIQPHEVEAIYFERYWREGKCDQMPDDVAMAHFDACVNHGPRAAAKLIQRAADVTEDGIIGPVTLGAVKQANDLVDTMLFVRLEFYRAITRDEASALVQVASAIRSYRHQIARDRIDKAEGLKWLRVWIKRLVNLREATRRKK